MTVLAAHLLSVLLLQGDPSAGAEALVRAVAEARRELAAEKERISREDAAQTAELTEVKAALARLTDELAERTRSVARKTRELEKAREERAQARSARSASREDWAETRRTAMEARLKMSDLVGALPPSAARGEQLARLDAARLALEGTADSPLDFSPLLWVSGSLLDEAHSIARFVHPVRNPDGAEEEVDVLRAGMIFHAYRSRSSGAVGEVFAAPGGSAGYRWSESLPEWARERVAGAFAASPTAPGALMLPLDVTQRMASGQHGGGRTFAQTFRAGGLVMYPLLALALLSVVIALERFLTLSVRSASSPAAIRDVLDGCRKGDVEAAARKASAGRGTPMRALSAALEHRAEGRAGMEEAVQEAMLHESPLLERFLGILAVFAGVSPMLGLLGTVMGMITTFEMIRVFGSSDPGIMAGGISEALVATATGLVLAIPLLLLHSWFSGKVDRILADAQRHATTLVNIVCGSPREEGVHSR